MAVGTAGVSTLGVKFGWGIGTGTTKPSSFTWLERCNSIGGIALDTEQIDASALEDEISKYIAGRQDTGGTFPVTFNLSTEVISQLEAMITAYNGLSGTQKLWTEVWSPFLSDGFYAIVQAPKHIPQPDMSQNELMTVEMTFILEDYKGMSTGIEPTASASA